MVGINWLNRMTKSDLLPPTTVSKKVRESAAWKKAMLDSFEYIAREQFSENLKFLDYYRMMDEQHSIQELKEVIPQLEGLQDLLDGVDIPSFLRHYPVLGPIIRDVKGKYRDMQDKYDIIETGDLAMNDWKKNKTEQFQKQLVDKLNKEIEIAVAKAGMTMEGKEFESPEEQQAYMQQLEGIKQTVNTPEKQKAVRETYPQRGVEWARITMEKDTLEQGLKAKDIENLEDKLLTGRCFRHYRIGLDFYEAENWSPKNTFFSKEVSSKFTQDGEYVGRLNYGTPGEMIKRHHHELNLEQQKEILGGAGDWRNFVATGYTATVEDAIKHNYNVPTQVPFRNYLDHNYYIGLQDDLGIPMGEYTKYNKDGSQETYDADLPTYQNRNTGSYKQRASVLRNDFEHRDDLCEELEGYVRVYELFGFLTYEDESGALVTEEVTEDILPQLLKDKGIKQIKKETIVDIIESAPEVDTIKWVYRPVTYEFLRITSGNLEKPIDVYVRPCKHQIKGKSMFDSLLPVAGYTGKGIAERIAPYQAAHNLCMNQAYNLMEKEIGVFFLMDVALIPSEIDGWGKAEDAFAAMANMAKDIGMMPTQTSGDMQKNQTHFNQFSTYNLSNGPQVIYRIDLAQKYKTMAYEQIGSNPQMSMQPTKYETATGVKVSNDASFAQLSNIFEEFEEYRQKAMELHISVAQYAQSNKKDITVSYTRDDSTIAWLTVSDPELPFRVFGAIPSINNDKRKELEAFKNYLMSNNTVNADFVEVAKLMYSDTMTEILEVAQELKISKDQAEEQAHKRQMELGQQQQEGMQKIEDTKFQRDLLKLDKTNETKIHVADITAKGRAADTEANQESFDQIDRSTENALKQDQINAKKETDMSKIQMHEKQNDKNFQLKMQELKLKAEDLRSKREMKNIDREIAYTNKN